MTLLDDFILLKQKAPDRIRAYRTARKLSQQKLGVLLGVSQAYISQIETGGRPASFNLLRKFIALEEK